VKIAARKQRHGGVRAPRRDMAIERWGGNTMPRAPFGKGVPGGERSKEKSEGLVFRGQRSSRRYLGNGGEQLRKGLFMRGCSRRRRSRANTGL